MSETIESMARGVGTQLISAERASNQAVFNTAALSVSLMEAAMVPGMSAQIGQTALFDISEAHTLAVKMRFHLARAHARMAADAADLGISWLAWGDEFPSPAASEKAIPANLETIS